MKSYIFKDIFTISIGFLKLSSQLLLFMSLQFISWFKLLELEESRNHDFLHLCFYVFFFSQMLPPFLCWQITTQLFSMYVIAPLKVLSWPFKVAACPLQLPNILFCAHYDWEATGLLVKRNTLWSQKTWVWISALPLSGCVTLGKLLNLSEWRFLHLQNEGNDTYLEELSWRWNGRLYTKSQAHIRSSVRKAVVMVSCLCCG